MLFLNKNPMPSKEQIISQLQAAIADQKGAFLGMYKSLFSSSAMDSIAVDGSTFALYQSLERLSKSEFDAEMEHLVDFYSNPNGLDVTLENPYAERVSFISSGNQNIVGLREVTLKFVLYGVCEAKVHHNIVDQLSLQTLASTAVFKLVLITDNMLTTINLSDLLTQEEYAKLVADINFDTRKTDIILSKYLETNPNFDKLKQAIDQA